MIDTFPTTGIFRMRCGIRRCVVKQFLSADKAKAKAKDKDEDEDKDKDKDKDKE